MSASNADQAQFWSEGPGRSWNRFRDDLDALHRGVLDLLLDAGAPRRGEAVLDVGCGAGATTLAFARATAPTGRADGVDISAPLVERAEERRRDLGARNASFHVADAQDHPFEAGRHDLAASRFGLMFFSDPVAAFRNIAAALRPGGRLVFAAWAGLDPNPWFVWPQRIAIARLGPVEPTPPDAPGPMAFGDVARVLAILRDAGLRGCRGEGVAVDLHHPDGIEAVLRLLPHVGPLARIMREKGASAEDRAAILDEVASAFGRFDGAGGIRISPRVNLFAASVDEGDRPFEGGSQAPKEGERSP